MPAGKVSSCGVSLRNWCLQVFWGVCVGVRVSAVFCAECLAVVGSVAGDLPASRLSWAATSRLRRRILNAASYLSGTSHLARNYRLQREGASCPPRGTFCVHNTWSGCVDRLQSAFVSLLPSFSGRNWPTTWSTRLNLWGGFREPSRRAVAASN